MTRTRARRRFRLKDLGRAVSWHRRKLAVVAAMAAVLTGISAALPPDPPTVAVVRSAARIDGGTVVRPDDLTVTKVATADLPDGALTDPAPLVGKTLTASVPKGQVLTSLNVLSAGKSAQPGRVIAPLRLADADLVALLQIGDAVDIIAANAQAGHAVVIARAVRIVSKPLPPDRSDLGSSTDSPPGALVLVDVDGKTAGLLAQATVTSALSVVMR